MNSTVVFIDSRVEDYQALIAGMSAGSEVVLLDSQSDGLARIATYLNGRSGIDSIHLISHGRAGALYLGSTLLDSETIGSYADQLQTIGQSLTTTGDLLLYACNVAADEAGVSFIRRLSELTGADVAASSDLTGAANLGGDWVLETATGSIEAGMALSAEKLAAWNSVLAANTAPTFVVGDGKVTTNVGGSFDFGYSITLQLNGKIVVAGSS